MGKVKKMKMAGKARHKPLEAQIADDEFARPSGRFKMRTRSDRETDEVVEPTLSRNILRVAKEQLAEEGAGTASVKSPSTVPLKPMLGQAESDSEGEGDGDHDAFSQSEEDYEDVEVDEEDEKALEMFMCKDPPARRTLADIIQEKITEKQTEILTQFSDAQSIQVRDLDPKIVELYKGVKEVLAKYRSGKLPKAFKIIPRLANWEQILYITDPEKWSAAAMYQATRIFTSNLKEKMAQRFFHLVLLPRVRDDIAEYKRLNFHLYQALRKALFKPGAFFKGFLIPLCESRTCSLREAIIIGSVLAKNSIPVLHSAAAMLTIAEMEYSGANSIFLRIFLDKKYALPYRVIDGVVHHLLRFQGDTRRLPVLWHQAFLTFVQRYKGDISSDQKEALLDLLKVHCHHQVGPEIRREILHSRSRDVEVPLEERDMVVE